jgi:hypothetical protein
MRDRSVKVVKGNGEVEERMFPTVTEGLARHVRDVYLKKAVGVVDWDEVPDWGVLGEGERAGWIAACEEVVGECMQWVKWGGRP